MLLTYRSSEDRDLKQSLKNTLSPLYPSQVNSVRETMIAVRCQWICSKRASFGGDPRPVSTRSGCTNPHSDVNVAPSCCPLKLTRCGFYISVSACRKSCGTDRRRRENRHTAPSNVHNTTMTMEAWYMDHDTEADQRSQHRQRPNMKCDLAELETLGEDVSWK